MNFMFECQEQYLTSKRSERVEYCSCHENIKFIPSSWRIVFFSLYKHTADGFFDDYSEDFRPLSEDFRRFSKIVPKAGRAFPNIFREFPEILALVKIVVASQHKRQRKRSLSRFVDNWNTDSDLKASARAALCKWATPTTFQTCLSKNFWKLSKQAETIKNRFWLWLSIVWETRKLTLYQPGVKSFLTYLFSIEHSHSLARADITSIHSQPEIKEIFDLKTHPFIN